VGKSHASMQELVVTSVTLTPLGARGLVRIRSEMDCRVETVPVLVPSSILYDSPGSRPRMVYVVNLELMFSMTRTF